jgi:hypothetical protein
LICLFSLRVVRADEAFSLSPTDLTDTTALVAAITGALNVTARPTATAIASSVFIAFSLVLRR